MSSSDLLTGGSGSPSKVPTLVALVVALLVVIASLLANIYLFQQVDQLRAELAEVSKTHQADVAKLQQGAAASAETDNQTTESLRDELKAARRQAAMAAGQAAQAAGDAKRGAKDAEDLARRLEQDQQKQQQAVRQELTQVQQAASVANEKIGAVTQQVGGVKSEIAATRSELEKTVADLRRVRGDLGVQSGLVATNAKELSALRQIGERNYFEFNLAKTKEAQQVGDVSVLLKRTDIKRNRYTIELLAEDKRVEKKDRSVNEPVQFYISRYRQPHELVVNQVSKDRITGYLSQPKVQAARN